MAKNRQIIMEDSEPRSIKYVMIIALLIIGVSIDRAVGAGEQVLSQTGVGVATVLAVEGSDEWLELTTGINEPQAFETVQGKLLNVCEMRGYGEDCARTLLGMLWKESQNISTAIGDNGQARGYFQIWYRLHHISIDCAEDLECSANWTIDYLESNGYPHHKEHAVQCHNGCNIWNGYWQSALRWGDRKWNTPMFLNNEINSWSIALNN